MAEFGNFPPGQWARQPQFCTGVIATPGSIVTNPACMCDAAKGRPFSRTSGSNTNLRLVATPWGVATVNKYDAATEQSFICGTVDIGTAAFTAFALVVGGTQTGSGNNYAAGAYNGSGVGICTRNASASNNWTVFQSDGASTVLDSGEAIPTSGLQLLVYTRNASGGRAIYRNGVVKATDSNTNGNFGTQTWAQGSLYNGSVSSGYWECDLPVLSSGLFVGKAMTAPEIMAWYQNFWQVFKPVSLTHYFDASTSSPTLSIADASHGHTADNLTLSTDIGLTIADATHGHSADNLILSSGSFLTVADALHGHAADNLTLSNDLSLTVADALHGHSADNLGLSTDVWLVVADASHGHTAGSLALFSDSFLVVADATHGHTADAVAMDDATTLSISKATHAHTADALALSVAIVLVVDDATHALTSDAVAIAANSILSVAKAVHAHTADVVSITISGTPTLTADDIAAIADAVWNHPKALTLARFIALK